jgi:hypothetical protein
MRLRRLRHELVVCGMVLAEKMPRGSILSNMVFDQVFDWTSRFEAWLQKVDTWNV